MPSAPNNPSRSASRAPSQSSRRRSRSGPVAVAPQPEVVPDAPGRRNQSRSASRAPSQSSKGSRSGSVAVAHHSEGSTARASSASGPYGVISAVAVPEPSSVRSRTSSASSHRPRSGSRPISVHSSPTAPSTVIDEMHPNIPPSPSGPLSSFARSRTPSVTPEGSPPLPPPRYSRSRSRASSVVIPDNSVDLPGEREAELPPQEGR